MSDFRIELDALRISTAPAQDQIDALADLADRLVAENERLADNHAVVRGWREREDRTERLGKLLDEADKWIEQAAMELGYNEVPDICDRIEQERDAK